MESDLNCRARGANRVPRGVLDRVSFGSRTKRSPIFMPTELPL